ncbi:MAG: DUF6705 family protein [Mucilaginibacter sp.]
MKKIFVFLAMLIVSINLSASSVKKDTLYVQDPSLHRFDGTWEYKDDHTIFTIIIKTEKLYSPEFKQYVDLVSGYHIYQKDGKIIQNSLDQKKTLTYGYYKNKDASKDILKFIFDDLGRPRSADAFVGLLPDGRLTWQLKNRGKGIVLVNKNGAPLKREDEDRGFHLPKDLILTKIK